MMYFWNVFPVLLAIPAQILFVLLYSVTAFGAGEWWKLPIGRALFAKSVGISIVGIMLVFDFFYSVVKEDAELSFSLDRTLPGVLLASSYWVVVVTIYYQLAVLASSRESKHRKNY